MKNSLFSRTAGYLGLCLLTLLSFTGRAQSGDDAGSISGASSVCITASTTFNPTVSGGIWSSSDNSIAMVDASGNVTGVSVGTAVISYTVDGVTMPATQSIMVNGPPNAATIGGPISLCYGTDIVLTPSVGGGTWAADGNTSVDGLGNVHAGTPYANIVNSTINYTLSNECGSATTSTTLEVRPAPDAGSIGGATTICPGNSPVFYYTATISGGSWSSDNSYVVNIDVNNGLVYNTNEGTANILYTVTNSCGSATSNTLNVTVFPQPDAGVGFVTSSLICPGASDYISWLPYGGTASWGTSNSSVAVVDGSGNVTGVGPGFANITMSVMSNSGCGMANASADITVEQMPNAGTLTGPDAVCQGDFITVSSVGSTILGPIWNTSNSNLSVFSYSEVATVTGNFPGTTTISYTVNNMCGTATATKDITVNPLPDAGSISGTGTINVGGTTALTDMTLGGAWTSSDNTIAMIDASGNVTGAGAGSCNIVYTVTNDCGTATATFALSVMSTTVDAGTISGASSVCVTATTALTPSVSGGAWTSSDNGVAMVDASGVVTGVAAGTATIYYTVAGSSSPASQTITVNGAPDAGIISGPTAVCYSSSVALSETVTGGTWGSDGNSSVDGSGNVFAGALYSNTVNSTITYTVTNECGSSNAMWNLQVNPAPNAGSIGGPTSICAGTSSAFYFSGSGTDGMWISDNTGVINIESYNGLINSAMEGTANLSYSVTNSCGTATSNTINVTVYPQAEAAVGFVATSQICQGANAFISWLPYGGTASWSSSNPSVAMVDGNGNVTGAGAGFVTINMSVISEHGCGMANASADITVEQIPNAGMLVGPDAVCQGGNISVSSVGSTILGPIWNTSNSNVSVFSSSEVATVTGFYPGTTTISYTVNNMCGTATATKNIVVNSMPDAGSISGTGSINVGGTTALTDMALGGTWTSSDNTIAMVDASGNVTGAGAGSCNIVYTVTNDCGTATATFALSVMSTTVDAGTISGASSVCVTATTALTPSVSGGAWTSSDNGVAMVDASGVVTGVAAGTATIYYTVAGSSAPASQSITVAALPALSMNILPISLCAGAVATFSATDSGSPCRTEALAFAYNSLALGSPYSGVTDNFTMEAWINWDGTGGAPQTIMANGNNSADGYGIWLDPTDGTIQGSIGNIGWVYPATDGATAVTVNVWHHVAIVRNTGTWSLYVDGTAYATNAPPSTPYTPAENFYIGCGYFSYNAYPFHGAIDEAKFWTMPRSTSEVNADMNECNTAPQTNLAGYWKLNEGTGNSAADLSGSGNNLNLANTNWVGLTGVAASSYAWSFGDGGTAAGASVSHTYASAGVYNSTLTATNGAGCTASTTNMVTVNSSPTAVIAPGAPVSFCSGDNIMLSPFTAVTGSTPALILGGAGNAPSNICDCPVGYVAVGYTGAAGGWLDKFGLICQHFSNGVLSGGLVTTSFNGTSTGGTPAGPYVFGSNQIMVGARMDSSVYFTQFNGVQAFGQDASYIYGGGSNSSSPYSLTAITRPDGSLPYGALFAPDGNVITGMYGNSGVYPMGVAFRYQPIAAFYGSSAGTWTSADATIASVTPGGTVTVLNSGSTAITYTVSNSCGTANAILNVTVNPLPVAGTISGATSVCTGAATALTTTGTGGTWSSSDIAIATVDASGNVTGVATGNVNIIYTVTNSCGTATSVQAITVNTLPGAGSITGASTVIAGVTTMFTETVSGGVWASSNGNATVNSTSGLVTGVSDGMDIISYTVTNSCGSTTATKPVSVLPAYCVPAPYYAYYSCTYDGLTFQSLYLAGIGSTSINDAQGCDGSGYLDRTTLSNSMYNGAIYNVNIGAGSSYGAYTQFWIDFNDDGIFQSTETVGGNSVSFNTSGIVNITIPSSANAGTHRMRGILTYDGDGYSYPNMDPCMSGYNNGEARDYEVNIMQNPAGTISGSSTACVSTAVALTESLAGGTWSSSNNGVATVSAAGVVSPVSAGTVNIYYFIAGDTIPATHVITFAGQPNAGTISSTSAFCSGATADLMTTGGAGGAWTSSNAHASVDPSGIVTGNSAGVDTITYTYTNICGSANTMLTITVNPVPSAGTISGVTTVCTNAPVALSSTVSGGVWTSSNSSIAAVDTTGNVTGVAIGHVHIHYTVTTVCGSNTAIKAMTVNSLPLLQLASAASTFCAGDSIHLFSTPAVAASNASPLNAPAAGGPTVVCDCPTGYAAVGYAVYSGAWIDRFSLECKQLHNGVVSGPSVFTNTAGSSTGGGFAGLIDFGSSNQVLVGMNANYNSYSYDLDGIQGLGQDAAYVWGSGSNASSASPLTFTHGSGAYGHPVYLGTVVVPDGNVITGMVAYNNGASNGYASGFTLRYMPMSSFYSAVPGSSWTSSASSVATVNTSGTVTGLSGGSANITYTVTNTCGSVDTVKAVTIIPTPNAGTISGAATVCAGSITTLTTTGTGGLWSSSNNAIATVDASGNVTGVASGNANITYNVVNICGTSMTVRAITVNPAPNAGIISGSSSACSGTMTFLSTTGTGGIWSSSNSAVASVNTSGSVTNVGTGTAVIAYTVTNGCGTNVASLTLTVSPLPAIGFFSSASGTLCQGDTLNLLGTPDVAALATSFLNSPMASGPIVTCDCPTGYAVVGYKVYSGSWIDKFQLECKQLHNGVVSGTSVFTNSAGSSTGAPNVATYDFSASNKVLVGMKATRNTYSNYLDGIGGFGQDASYIAAGGSNSTAPTALTLTHGNGLYGGPAALGSTLYVPDGNVVTGMTAYNNGASNGYASGFALRYKPIATFNVATSAGTWTSHDPAIATVNASGVVKAINTGNTTITYSVSNSCGTIDTVKSITVNPLPVAGTVSGVSVVCVGGTISLTSSATGGTWISGNPSRALVNASGVVSGQSGGSVTISYSVTNGCGTAVATKIITVNPVAIAGTIVGASSICQGSVVSLSNSATGGTWTASNGAIASVSATGVVSGVSLGSAVISYAVGGCFVTAPVTVNISPAAITGVGSAICNGSSVSLSNSVPGGTWAVSNTTLATISTTGVIMGTGIGALTISYTVGNCSSTSPVSVNDVPSVIGGMPTACVGSTTVLTNALSGAVWSSNNTAIASVSASGVVTGVSSGIATISYTSGICYSVQAVTVYATPGAITGGTPAICNGSSISLANSVAGGTWATNNPIIASVSNTGVITGTGIGVLTISYSIGTCNATRQLSVNDVPSVIGGVASACVGSTTVLSNALSGGIWSSNNSAVASISASGTVSGVNAGIATISYTNGVCYSVKAVTVYATPGAITGGTPAICNGSSISLANSVAGGTWGTNNPIIASVSNTGVITGTGIGVLTISYSIGTCSATRQLSVNDVPAAIGGTASVCVGSTTVLSNALSGAVWSSNNTAVASISAIGVVSGLSPGIATISYTSGVCYAVKAVTVYAVPGAITGGTAAICNGSSISLGNSVTGGVWSTDNTALVSVSSSGVVTGRAIGALTISYSIGTCYATRPLSVNDVPAAIGGTASVCRGATSILSDALSGGIWSSANTGVATISATGTVSGVNAGIATISYTNGVCYAVKAVTVYAVPAAITGGTAAICNGTSISLSNSVAGGVWGTDNTSLVSVSSNGVVTGTGIGNLNISYTIGVCPVTRPLTVNNAPAAIGGTAAVCVGSTTILTDALSGAAWSSTNAGVASISASGVVSGVSTGNATISYTSGVCYVVKVVSVYAVPGIITGGTAAICNGTSISLSNSVAGGVWGTDNTILASVSSSGVVTGTGVGSLNVRYTIGGTCTSTRPLTVNIVPAAISGLPSVCRGATTVFSDGLTGAVWSTSSAAVASVNSSNGTVYGVAVGSATISYTAGVCFVTKVISVNNCQGKAADSMGGTALTHAQAGNIDVSVYPNPATNMINIMSNVPVNVIIYSSEGRMLISQKDAHEINVDNLTPGVYIMTIYDEQNNLIKTERLIRVQ